MIIHWNNPLVVFASPWASFTFFIIINSNILSTSSFCIHTQYINTTNLNVLKYILWTCYLTQESCLSVQKVSTCLMDRIYISITFYFGSWLLKNHKHILCTFLKKECLKPAKNLFHLHKTSCAMDKIFLFD